jgi:thiosulfate/3-mercaptopyruvate sulfurtransferase
VSGPGLSAPLLSAPIVSAQWLADHLGSEKLVVLDATVLPAVQPNGKPGHVSGHDQYLINGHIPGAIFADLIEVFSDPNGTYKFTRPSAELFAIAAGSVGVDNESTVVVYDSTNGQWASRMWWLFRAFGYTSVAVLDGGFTKWLGEGRETDVGHVEPVVTTFETNERAELWADKSEVEKILEGSGQAALVCALPYKEYTGEAGHRSRLGHIPQSLSVPVGRLSNPATNSFASEDTLRTTFAPVLPNERIVVYCSLGIAATSDALALTLLGHTNVAVYDGSMTEWVADPAAPVVTGS